MLNILIKNRFILSAFLLATMFMVPTPASAYTVNGVVDFTYSSFQTKIGNITNSYHTFTEHYAINTSGYIYDPRFLRLNAGIGYSRMHSSATADYNMLNYNVNASFFPGRMISWELYAAQSTMTVQGNASLDGYNVDLTSYGAVLDLRLSKYRRRPGNTNVINNGNNNNNSNNSNNNSNNSQEARRRWSYLSYPDLSFSRSHQESESASKLNPQHETRDNTSASILYRVNSTFDMHLSGMAEEYKNLLDGSSYDNRSAKLLATARILSTAELKINGTMDERNVSGIPGFDGQTTRNMRYGANLEFKEKNSLAHSYGYDYTNSKAGANEYTIQTGFAHMKYMVLPELSLYGQLNYSASDYVHQATLLSPYETSSSTSGGLSVGANYKKKYSPAFLDPFVLTTNYDFTSGFTKMSTLADGNLGGGIYYQNAASVGFFSSGWKYETINLESSYISRRDNSPMNNDVLSQNYRLLMSTKRLPRTNIDATVSYRIQESSASSLAGPFSAVSAGLSQSSRSLEYTASIDHSVNQNLNLSAGATQGRAKTNNGYTLSTLTSAYDVKQRLLYAQALFNYAFTRDLRFSASMREEKRNSDYDADQTSYQAGMTISHRIRALILSAEWRWREDITDTTPRIFQQSLMLKVSRPF